MVKLLVGRVLRTTHKSATSLLLMSIVPFLKEPTCRISSICCQSPVPIKLDRERRIKRFFQLTQASKSPGAMIKLSSTLWTFVMRLRSWVCSFGVGVRSWFRLMSASVRVLSSAGDAGLTRWNEFSAFERTDETSLR